MQTLCVLIGLLLLPLLLAGLPHLADKLDKLLSNCVGQEGLDTDFDIAAVVDPTCLSNETASCSIDAAEIHEACQVTAIANDGWGLRLPPWGWML